MAKKKAAVKRKTVKKPGVVKRKKAAPKVRGYDNSMRSEKSNTARQRILELYINLLVERNGDDVPLQMLAKKSKTSMRTLFRFFGDKESLNKEISGYLTRFMPTVNENIEKMSYEEYAEFSYRTFGKHEKLFRAYLYTGFGQKSRLLFRKDFISLLTQKIYSELGSAKLSPENTLKVYLLACLINANIWNDMREGFQVGGEDLAQVCRWAIRTLLKELRRDVQSNAA